ncbi:MAG: hypothetical protein GX562_00380, partial [Coriobacteriaceae bacterium]|nr:hypothetical protein [Coriobacteriaceae bacterium]
MPTRQAQMFSLAVILTILMITAEGLSDLFTTYGSDFAPVTAIVNAIGFALSPLIGVTLAAMFRTEDRKLLVVLTIALLPNALLAISSPLTGLTFSVSSQNVYARGPMFWLF